MPRCCPECFGDRGLRKNIFATLDPVHGNCDFCGALGVDLIEPQRLADVFELLTGVYEPDKNGARLVKWLRNDWQLFSHPNMDDARANDLLGQIFGDKLLVDRPFVPSPTYTSKGLAQWSTFCEELMYQNRYFLNEPPDLDRLKQLLDHLPADNLPAVWQRARILPADAPLFPIGQMGAPPKRSSSHGRANPAGIPYLYLSSQPDTAVAEIRPHTGEVACVAEFTVAAVSAVDLRNPRKLVSPFVLADASAIGQLRADVPFLERLGDELTRPVLPSAASIDYIPSQYLCEFIKKCGYDGVVYRSSVSEGFNLALFDEAKAAGGVVSRYGVTKVTVLVEKLV
jgi:RES domain-containing protein